MFSTPDVEPTVAAWERARLDEVVRRLVGAAGRGRSRAVVAVDGRSASGKSTFADRLSAHIPGSVVVRTDDVAWWESFFEWDHLLVEGVLRPVRSHAAVRYRPPAWDRRGRDGAIEVPAEATAVVVEGVGVARRSLGEWFDASVWLQSDLAEARRRGIERDGGTPGAEAFWDEWDRAELEFLARDRPWERATLTICGTPHLTTARHDPRTEVLVAPTRRS